MTNQDAIDIQQMIDAENERLGRRTIGSTRDGGITVDTTAFMFGLQKAQDKMRAFAEAANSNYSGGRRDLLGG